MTNKKDLTTRATKDPFDQLPPRLEPAPTFVLDAGEPDDELGSNDG